jgi:hypothetical protein
MFTASSREGAKVKLSSCDVIQTRQSVVYNLCYLTPTLASSENYYCVMSLTEVSSHQCVCNGLICVCICVCAHHRVCRCVYEENATTTQ